MDRPLGRRAVTEYRIETEGAVTTGNSNHGRQPKVSIVVVAVPWSLSDFRNNTGYTWVILCSTPIKVSKPL